MTAPYIVDAHHHLWDLTEVDYPWLQQRGVRRFFGDPTPIQKHYTVEDFRDDHGIFEVRKSVHIQVGTAPGSELAETSWLDRQAQANGLPSAIVAYCNLASADAPDVIAQHMERSAALRGVRQIFSRHADEDARDASPNLIEQPKVAASLKHLAQLGLSFDLQLTPPYMIAAARLLGKIDGLNVALCHAGSPWRRDSEGLAEWCKGLCALSEVPGVACKLSGFGMFDHDWQQRDLKPLVLTVLEIFGPERVMWGSNFPVDKLYRSYDQLLTTMLAIVPAPLHDQVFRKTAEAFYRL